MFNKLIYFSIHNKLIIGLLTLALIAWGGYSLYRLPIDAVPDITNNQVVVYTVAPSLAANDIERLVSFPIEQSVATIPGEGSVRSFSRFGLSVVTIVFEDGIDIYWARQQVAERLREAESQIPTGVGRPELAPVSTGLGEIYQYLVRPKPGYEKKYNARDLRTIQDWIVRRQLLGTPGVADVSSFGGLLKQYEVSLDPERLRSLNVTVDEVYQAVSRNNQNTGGAYLDKNPTAYSIRTEGLVANPQDIGNIVVKSTKAGLPILVRDVAEIRLGSAVRYGAMTRNNEGEVTGGIVLMLKGANANDVIKAVKERMVTIRKSLPEGVVVDVYLDRSDLVGRAIHTVTKNLIEGALIVIFVLVVFLGNLRAGLVVASVIPLAMLFAISMMQLFGVSGNLLSLGAIDFGLVVDGAVIIVEGIIHRLHSGGQLGQNGQLTQRQMDGETYHAAAGIRDSAGFPEVIILIVYLPLLALAGIEGKMFKPMAETVVFAIVGALILSLTYVPMMAALGLSRKTEHKRNFSDKMMSWLEARYRPLITLALARKTIVLGTSVALLVGTILLFRTLGGEFIPQLSEGDFAVEMRVLTGSSLSYTIEKATQAGAILKKQFPEVKEVVAKIGSAEIPTDPMPVEAADVMVTLKDPKDWTSAKSQPELAEKMARALSVIPGVTFGFQQPIQMRFNELISGAKQDVVMKIYGEDLDQLADYATRTATLVRQVQGAEDVYVEQVTGLPQIVVKLDRNKLAQFGLNVEDVNRTVQTAFAGQTAGQVFEQERRFDLVLRLPPALRKDITSVRQLFIATPRGEQVPLEQVADVSLVEGPNQIQRDNAKRRIIVAFNVRGRDVESVVKELQGKVDQQLKLAPGYYTTYGGQFENLREASQRLSIAVPVALLLIFGLLFFTFRSLLQATMIFTAIPLSAIGGVLSLWLRDMPFSISAGVGFIALFGVAVLNGVVLIGYFNQLKKEGVTDLTQRILEGTATRLRPVLMTATVASLGFLPMALATSAGAEVQRPLATVVIGGLVTATLLTLLVLPVLYALAETWQAAHGEYEGDEEPTAEPKPHAGVAGPAPSTPLVAGAVLLLLALPLAGRAQQVQLSPAGGGFTAQQAITQALQSNGTVAVAERSLEAQQALRRTATDVGRTTIGVTYGQYNTYRQDNNFTISQTFSLPGVYRRQALLLNAQVSGQQFQLAQVQAELRRQVRLNYEQAVFARHRVKVLRGQDSLYTEFLRAANLRFKTGEVARLEPATALVQQGETRALIRQARTGYQVAQRQLQALLQQSQAVNVADSLLRPLEPVVLPALGDTVRLAQNPQAQVLRQLIAQRQAATQAEQALGLPNVTLGYFNQSLKGPQTIGGVGGPEQDYTGSDRFQGVQGSVGIPILRGPQKARVRAARLQEQVATVSYRRQLVELAGRQDELVARHAEQQQRLQFYQQTGLPQADVIVRLSTRAFKAGETGYSEYLLNLERALSIRTAYLDVLLDHNQTVIELDYLLNSTPQ